MQTMLQAAAKSLIARRTSDGGWGPYLSAPEQCPGGAETSATALLTFFLARGVNDGWLDRKIYDPIVMKAFTLLMHRVDASGDVTAIQPPGVGPACDLTSSYNPAVNVNFGPGAVLLAASEVLKFSDEDLGVH
jgi:rhamnogalacturonyl hydrolase YesR